ncbi:MAG: metallophosphoesterase [Verrucomicrobia bacterium]|nr:metallophosphoesterase [Verrucomicrobiota bacterium]
MKNTHTQRLVLPPEHLFQKSLFQNRSRRREEAPFPLKFEPPHVGCYRALKSPHNSFFPVVAVAALLFLAANAGAANVGPSGYGNAFDAQPPAADWATSSASGGAGDTYDSDADVNASLTAAGMTTQTTADAANPAAQAANAVWSSTGLFLQTRPTGNRYTALMGKFVNATGTNATQVTVSYLLTIAAAGGVSEDSGKGTRVYYSLTGLANSWTHVAALSTTESADGSSTLTANLAVTWTNGASLYLLWVDDNASGMGTDSANQIDNFSLQVTAGTPLSYACAVTAPAQNALFVSGSSIVAAGAVANGTAPYTVQYFTNSGVGNTTFELAGSSGTAPYEVSLGSLAAGTYNIYAVATDSAGTPVSTNSLTNTFFVADPIAFTLTAPANDAIFDNTTSVEGTATVSGGTPPYAVQFYLDNVTNGAPVMTAPYSRDFGPLFVGDHTVRAAITDANGWVSNSAVSTIHITGPLAVTLTPTNGTSYNYGQQVTLAAVPGGGTAPYLVSFLSVDGGVFAAVGDASFTTNLGMWAVGSYTCYAHAVDSSLPPQQADSSTNVIRILENPLVANLTSPANLSSAPDSRPLSLAVTATVGAPVTVSQVDFYYDGALAGSDNISPYLIQVTNPVLGIHRVYAVATDSLGRTTVTATNQVTVIVDPLANNNFTNRTPLTTTPAVATGSNVGATTEPGEPTGSGLSGRANTLWWSWIAPATGPVTITTSGSTFNVGLGVFRGTSVNALTQVGFSGSVFGGTTPTVNFAAQQGTEYQIQVGGMGFGGNFASGSIQLTVTMPPSVTITSPTNNSTFLTGSNVFITATATSVLGSLQRVDFYTVGDSSATMIGSVSNAPYTLNVSNLTPGTNRLAAVAYDSLGQGTVSSYVTLLVLNVGVTIIAPADGAIYGTMSPINVSVLGLLPEGAITNVEFFVNGQKFAEDGSVPFSGRWTNVVGGSHRLTAVGLSDAGVTYNSTPVNIAVAQTLVASNAVWKYLDNGSDQGMNWIASDFDDSAWASGPAPLGYSDSNGRQPLTTNSFGPDSNNKFLTTYYRQTVVLSNLTKYTTFTGRVQRDDGAIIYVNGQEASRLNMPSGVITYTNRASGTANDDGGTTYSTSLDPALFREGINVIAVEIHQEGPTSSDIWFDLELLGVPPVIRNLYPTVALTSPSNEAFFYAPASIPFLAEAADADGSVAKVEFFAGNTKLGESTEAPYTLTWPDVPAGTYVFTAVVTDNQGGTGSAAATVRVFNTVPRWTAINDHYAGPGTHPNATAWNAFGAEGGAPGDEGALRNLQTGAPLAANLTVMQFGAFGDPVSGAPATGTPAYDSFNGWVDFGSGEQNHAILVNGDSLVMHLFTGLDPLRSYSFRGTAVGGVANSSNRWTHCTIVGADSFLPAHTANVLTSTTQPALAADEAALNTGDNRSGDMVGWDNIAPGADGSFIIVSSQYLGPAPGNGRPGPYAYAPVAMRLEEWGSRPLVYVTVPADGAVITGPTNITLTAVANTVGSIANVLFLTNGAAVGSVTAPPFTTVWTNPFFGDYVLSAIATDAAGVSATSAPVTMHLITPPTNTVAPIIASQNPVGGATLTNLTSVQVRFSQRVVGVDAADLLINEVPATNVTGSGSNYLFSFVHPPYGLVRVTWSSNAAIHDLSWPENLPFYDNNPDNYWSYTLIDRTLPAIAAKTPAAGAILTNLTAVSVTFSEPVTGVNASDLLVNGVPAYAMSGSGVNYTFSISQPTVANVSISWATSHGILDLAVEPNAFNRTGAGATWSYTLDLPKTIFVQSNSVWALVKGTNEASIPTNAWRQLGFDDSGWSNAAAPFFYGDPYTNYAAGIYGTSLSDMRSNYTCIYLRQTFVVPNAAAINNLSLRSQSDDGYIAWINGVQVLRYNAGTGSGDIPYNGVSSATSTEPNNAGAAYNTYPVPISALVSGTNVLAIQALNENLNTSSDFGFNAQLYTVLTDTEVVAPRLTKTEPAAGYVYSLTNLTVTFSERVTNVEAADLLLNGVPATGLTGVSNRFFTFSFPQPPYGPVAVSWVADHGIVDLDLAPKPFDGTAAESIWSYTLLNPLSPQLLSVTPAQGSTNTALTEIAVVFNEAVTGLEAGDLLLNGVPASGLSGSGSAYTFAFAQPPYGTVVITWATNHGIANLAEPPQSFDTLWPNHTWSYWLVDLTPPTVAAQEPPAGSAVTNLTQLSVTFTEPVLGVNASDLLINGKPASAVTSSNTTYTFTFAQPNAAFIAVTWAANHGIRDQATIANAFNATAPGASWTYATVDNLAPTPISLAPAPASSVRSLQRITVTFDEPVLGVDAGSLTVNGAAASQMAGAGAGPYTFYFTQPPTGAVQVALSPAIWDLAALPNQYRGSNWTYVLDTNLPLPSVTRGPYLQLGTPTSMVVRWRTATATDTRLRYGLASSALTLTNEDGAVTTEHIVTLSNLAPYTVYYYAIGTTDSDLAGGSDDYTFRTHPTNAVPTRIWFISDYGFRNADERSVRESYFTHVTTNKPANVWITGGDNDQTDGSEGNYTASVFGADYGYAPLLRRLPMFPTIGNHDYQTQQGVNYYANFTLPTRGEAGGVPSGTEHYYSFNYGDVHFINLDSIDGTLSRTADTAMLQWLREDLTAATQRWIIAYWHGPPYSKGSHDSDSDTDTLAWMVQMRQIVVPVLESYGVDLVLCGHSHVYERSWPLFGHYGYSASFNETNKVQTGDGRMDGAGGYRQSASGVGTVYVTAGISGQPRTLTDVQHPAHFLKKTGILGSLVIDIDGDRLDLQYLNTSGVAEDYFTILKGSEASPKLAIWHSLGVATVAWPASAAGFQLQFKGDTAPAGAWQNITNGIGTNGSLKVFDFDPRAGAPAGFFRLEKR